MSKLRVELSKSVVPWPQDDTRATVERAVEENEPDMSLALIDSYGLKVERRLLDDLLNGRDNVYRFTVADETPLASKICQALGLNQTLDFARIANYMREARQPLFRRPRVLRRKPTPDPAVVIVECSPEITNASTVTRLLWDTTYLKEAGGDDIITIVCMSELADESLPKGLGNSLKIVRVPEKPA
mmetsp:Transcript_2018/g.6695  ORF Transcript_2018/g.6695 Transcript_2018/m.6695 type:complete len:186 (-) Transcript_2018:563-1120(-)